MRQRLHEALRAALHAHDARAASTLRLILAALKDRDIAERGKGNSAGLNNEQILALLRSMIKQRRESITLYEQGNRPDLVDQEKTEIAIIERFLPAQLSEAAMTDRVREIVGECEAKSLRDMGRVMAVLKERHAGDMDLGRASQLVRSLLAGEA